MSFFVSRFLQPLSALKFSHFFRPSAKERLLAAENISMLISSGMGMTAAIEVAREESSSRTLKRVLGEIADEIANGEKVSIAFDGKGLFSGGAISLIAIGEESGQLAENLIVVAENERKQEQLRSRIRGAMAYPLVVLSITIIVGIVIAWFVLPRLAVVFKDLNIPLPLITRVLIGGGQFFSDYGHIFFPVVIVVLVGLGIGVSRSERMRQAIARGLFRIPSIRSFLMETEVARFGFLFGSLLKSGVPISIGLEALSRATTLRPYQELYAKAKNRMIEGETLANSLSGEAGKRTLFPHAVIQLMSVAEKSGSLEETLFHIGERYEEKSTQSTATLSVLLEPVLLVLVWLGVVAVALAVILPIYSLVGGFNAAGV